MNKQQSQKIAEKKIKLYIKWKGHNKSCQGWACKLHFD